MTMRFLPALLAALAVASCASQRPSRVVPDLPPGPVVLVKECRIPTWEPWYSRFAVHSWIDVRDGEGRWERIGVPGPSTDVVRTTLDPDEARTDERWERPVRVVDVVAGERAAAAIEGLGSAEEAWTPGSYRAFPGPNSNTFIERLARRTPGLAPRLSPRATGRDFSWIRAGATGSGTGVELETPLLGGEVGLREGVQLHVAQLPVGVRLWPPAVVLPFLPAIGPRFRH